MTDRFTEVSSQGFFSRMFGSLVGLLLGPILVIGAIVLISWNEGRAVQAITGLGDAAKALVETPADQILPANQGKLVHIVGPATAAAPVQDSDLALDFAGEVSVKRTVEMYQWKEKEQQTTQNNLGGSQTTTATYTYSEEWSPAAVDSSTFKHPEGHQNPAMPFASRNYTAGDAKLGAFVLDQNTLGPIEPPTLLKPDVPQGWTSDGGNLYRGANPAAPAVGDLRVRYTGLPSGSTISVLAQQSGNGFGPYTTANGYTIELAREGNASASQMLADQKKAESTLTWILRGVGALLMFIGFMLFFGPIAMLASVVPFLGSLVRGASAAFAFVLSIPLTLITIAIAWIAFRPLIGGGLIVAALALFYALWRWHHGRTTTKSPA